MPFTRKALASVWFVVLGLFALSASDMIVGKNALGWFLGGLVTPAIILTLAAKFWSSAATIAPFDARALAASDANDLLRMDSDKG
jgi:hypothetical protein